MLMQLLLLRIIRFTIVAIVYLELIFLRANCLLLDNVIFTIGDFRLKVETFF